MSNELISTQNFKAGVTGLEIAESVTYDEWLEFGEKLARVDGASPSQLVKVSVLTMRFTSKGSWVSLLMWTFRFPSITALICI